MRIPRKIKKKIPKGMYCYTFTGKISKVWHNEAKQFVSAFNTNVCPLYFKNNLGYGDCKYMVKSYGILNGEDDDLDICLDDQCKACNFKKL